MTDQSEDARRLQLALDAAETRLRQIEQSKADFIAIASHELRTPLTQLRGYTEILDALAESGSLDAEQVGQIVGNIRRASDRMDALLTQMLDLSQIDMGTLKLQHGDVSPEAAVRMAVEQHVDALRRRHIGLAAYGLRALPPIHGDFQRLVQAFSAIVSNAVRFTPDGGRIEIRGQMQTSADGASTVLLTFADTGVGIGAEHIELIFGRFYRGHDASLHSTDASRFMGAGPGLGLTIARGIIEAHGGQIRAVSTGHDIKGCPGSTFLVTLPLTAAIPSD